MVAVSEIRNKKLHFWLWTVLDYGKAWQALKNTSKRKDASTVTISLFTKNDSLSTLNRIILKLFK